MKDKEILIQGYWVQFAKKLVELEGIKNYDAKDIKEKFIEGIDILDKIIELKENENEK